jgi:hypothetical protein
MTNKILQELGYIARRFFSAPFGNLPSEYGDPVPPEIRMFEAEASQKEVRNDITTPIVRDRGSRPALRDESLERE